MTLAGLSSGISNPRTLDYMEVEILIMIKIAASAVMRA
jgi:hypothetical protein